MFFEKLKDRITSLEFNARCLENRTDAQNRAIASLEEELDKIKFPPKYNVGDEVQHRNQIVPRKGTVSKIERVAKQHFGHLPSIPAHWKYIIVDESWNLTEATEKEIFFKIEKNERRKK